MSEMEQWIHAAAKGEMGAFRKIYDHYLGQVTRTVGRYLGPGPAVEDVVQEVFVQLHGSLNGVSDVDAFGGWVYRISRNVAISHLRKQKSSVDFVTLKMVKEPTSQWRRLAAREQVRALYAALDCLSAEQREAVIMYEIEGHTLQEIADLTDTSINTIASRVRRGRQQLIKLLERVLSGSTDKEKEQA